MTDHKTIDYDLELSNLLKHFEPYNLLIGECKEINLSENSQPSVTIRWVDNTIGKGESKYAHS
jgi:hypothetical protein